MAIFQFRGRIRFEFRSLQQNHMGTFLGVKRYIWMFPKIVGKLPQSHPKNYSVFHYFKPSILGETPLFLETPIGKLLEFFLGGGHEMSPLLRWDQTLMAKKTRWWFQIFFIFTPIWEIIQFD